MKNNFIVNGKKLIIQLIHQRTLAQHQQKQRHNTIILR